MKKSENNKCWQGCGEKEALVLNGWECKFVQSLWKTSWKFLKKLKKQLPCDPAIPLPGIYQKTVNTNLKRYMNSNVYYSLIYNRKNMEATSEQNTHGSCLQSTCMEYGISKHLNTTVILRNNDRYMFFEMENSSSILYRKGRLKYSLIQSV